MARLTIRGYARHRGVSHTAVRKAIAAGRIGTDAEGNIDPTQADEQWASSTNLSKPRNSVTGVPKLRRDPAAPPEVLGVAAPAEPMPEVPSEGGATRLVSSYAASRAAREGYAARLTKLEYEQRSGKLVDADEVRAHLFGLSRRMRDALLGIPDRLAPVLVGQSDQAVIHQLITEELMTSLGELSKAPPLRFGPRSETPK